MASTMSLNVTPRCLAVSLTSASDSDAVANVRAGEHHVVEERRRRLEHLRHVRVFAALLRPAPDPGESRDGVAHQSRAAPRRSGRGRGRRRATARSVDGGGAGGVVVALVLRRSRPGPSAARAGWPTRDRRPVCGAPCRSARIGRRPCPRRSGTPTAGGRGPAGCWRSRRSPGRVRGGRPGSAPAPGAGDSRGRPRSSPSTSGGAASTGCRRVDSAAGRAGAGDAGSSGGRPRT